MKNQTHLRKKITALAMTAILTCSIYGCTAKKSESTAASLDPDNPVTVTIWNYYNGDQLALFEQLVEEFNSTVGTEKGVTVTSVSLGNVDTLADSLLDSVNEKAGSEDTPTLASVYSETAYILDKEDALVSFDDYFTEDELSAYVPGFVEEGRFNENNDLLLFPLLKSSEIFAANQTDWEAFADDTGISITSLKTKEDLTAAAQRYYEWTDAQTPDVPDDGKALYGRDAIANYIYVGSYELGHELFKVEDGQVTVDMDRDTFKMLWDNYYIPYINGYFAHYANYSSEDAKTGKILALTSSSSGVTFLPSSVTDADDTTHDIQMYETQELSFADATERAVVQQGASYCLLKSTEAQQDGAALFLKWATESERNLDFALKSGYSPVTTESNRAASITKAYDGDTSSATGQNILDALLISADGFNNDTAYATKPFYGSKDVRSLLQSALQGTADADRKTVTDSIAAGMSRKDAVAQFSTEEYFDSWFQKLCEDVNATLKQ